MISQIASRRVPLCSQKSPFACRSSVQWQSPTRSLPGERTQPIFKINGSYVITLRFARFCLPDHRIASRRIDDGGRSKSPVDALCAEDAPRETRSYVNWTGRPLDIRQSKCNRVDGTVCKCDRRRGRVTSYEILLSSISPNPRDSSQLMKRISIRGKSFEIADPPRSFLLWHRRLGPARSGIDYIAWDASRSSIL